MAEPPLAKLVSKEPDGSVLEEILKAYAARAL
jgi:hypothetical protein